MVAAPLDPALQPSFDSLVITPVCLIVCFRVVAQSGVPSLRYRPWRVSMLIVPVLVRGRGLNA